MKKFPFLALSLALVLGAASLSSIPAWAAMRDDRFVSLCFSGSPEDIQAALDDGANVNAKRKGDDMSALMAAASFNDPEAVKALLKAGADVDAVNEDGATALFSAAASPADDGRHSFEIVKLLLDPGANVNVKTKEGWTALRSAAVHTKDPRVILLLLEAGAEVKGEKDWDGRLPIDHARRNRALAGTEALKRMEEMAADNNSSQDIIRHYVARQRVSRSKKNFGSAPARAALPDGEFLMLCYCGSAEEVQAALEAGADPDVRDELGNTALIQAAMYAKEELIDALLDAGADPLGRNYEGERAVDYARMSGSLARTKARERLIDLSLLTRAPVLKGEEFLRTAHGLGLSPALTALLDQKKVGAKDVLDDEGTTLLMYAARRAVEPKILERIIAEGADVDARERSGMTALMFAAHWNFNPKGVAALLRAGADVNAVNRYGMTPLMLALCKDSNVIRRIGGAWYSSNLKTVLELLKASPDLEVKALHGSTALRLAIQNSKPEVVKALIAAGADVNARTENGSTMLIAASRGDDAPQVLSALLEAGAEIDAADQAGRTALMLAARWNKAKVVDALLAAGADVAMRDNEGKCAADHAAENGRLSAKYRRERLGGAADTRKRLKTMGK